MILTLQLSRKGVTPSHRTVNRFIRSLQSLGWSTTFQYAEEEPQDKAKNGDFFLDPDPTPEPPLQSAEQRAKSSR